MALALELEGGLGTSSWEFERRVAVPEELDEEDEGNFMRAS